MFEKQDALRNPPMSQAQKLCTWCSCTGMLLNAISSYTAPHHTHRALWMAVDVVTVPLSIAGILGGISILRREFALKRQRRAQSAPDE